MRHINMTPTAKTVRYNEKDTIITMPKYDVLPADLVERMEYENRTDTYTRVACPDSAILRRHYIPKDEASIWRPAFVHDVDKILHCPYYNRYTDKTQVFSLFKNDDICRRSLHVQLVSRIARTIGSALHLNLNLIEAIALGHDIGHPPFAHAGEHFLDEIYVAHTGRHFSHTVQSVRVLDKIFPYNISLQTLSGIVGHNVKLVPGKWYPAPVNSFAEFDVLMERCYDDPTYRVSMAPSTLEGYVVRLSDIISYLGKDRQDAARTGFISEDMFENSVIGSTNAEIINNVVVNIIQNSYGKPYLAMDPAYLEAMMQSRADNHRKIYSGITARARFDLTVKPMMAELYDKLLDDLTKGRTDSPIFTQHIAYANLAHYHRETPYEETDPQQIVVDYIASMTDDYFVDLYRHFFPNSTLLVEYRGYFD